MADFYLRVVAEEGRRTRIAAICYQEIEDGRPADRLHILFSAEFGEKEILKKIKALGLFEGNDRFSPLGPDLRGDLTLLTSCAAHHGIIELKGDDLRRFIEAKASAMPPYRSTAEKGERRTQALLTEKAGQIVERVTREAELFLKDLQLKSDGL